MSQLFTAVNLKKHRQRETCRFGFFFLVAAQRPGPLRRCGGAGQIYAVVFGQTEETRSGGMTASQSWCWQKCCCNLEPKGSAGEVIQKDEGDAHWPDQAGDCQCGETKETASPTVSVFALKLSGLHSKLYLERCCHENIPANLKVFPSLCLWQKREVLECADWRETC